MVGAGGLSSPVSGTEGFYPSLSACPLYPGTILAGGFPDSSSEQKSREIGFFACSNERIFFSLLFDSSLLGALHGKELVSADPLVSEVPKGSKLPW